MPACRSAIVAVAIAGAASRAQAQRVSLELRPRVGDTISMRLEQETDVSGRRDAKSSANASSTPSSSMSSTSISWSRAIVESAVPAYTTIDAVTDSVMQPNQ